MHLSTTTRSPLGARAYLGAAATVAAALVLSACGGPASTTTPSDTLTIAVSQAPQGLTLPTNCTSPIFQLTYDPLIKVDKNGEYAPNLATSWEYSDNNTTFTMKIRDGVKFADGSELPPSQSPIPSCGCVKLPASTKAT